MTQRQENDNVKYSAFRLTVKDGKIHLIISPPLAAGLALIGCGIGCCTGGYIPQILNKLP